MVVYEYGGIVVGMGWWWCMGEYDGIVAVIGGSVG